MSHLFKENQAALLDAKLTSLSNIPCVCDTQQQQQQETDTSKVQQPHCDTLSLTPIKSRNKIIELIEFRSNLQGFIFAFNNYFYIYVFCSLTNRHVQNFYRIDALSSDKSSQKVSGFYCK